MEILSITDCPQMLPLVVEWERAEWGDEWAEVVKTANCRDKIPTIYVALENQQLVGCAMLIKHDMMTRKDLTPWLGGIFVPPDHRRRGIAGKLVCHALDKAKEIGVKTLWLYTASSRNLYARYGWRFVEELDYLGEVVTLMRYDFST